MATLFLEKRGCDFFKNDEINKFSDVGNYRVDALNIPGKDGNTYILEFSRGTIRNTRYTNLRTGKPLKHPKIEIINEYGMYMSTYYENENGCFGNVKLDAKIDGLQLSYTLENILKAVNLVSSNDYTEIKFL